MPPSGPPSFAMPDPKRILVVNDDKDALFLIGRALKRSFPQAEICSALNGMEALNLLATCEVDAVVTDNRMSSMSGIELTTAIRSKNAHIPIVVVSGADDIAEEAVRAGATIFFGSKDWSGLGAALQAHWSDRDSPSIT
jgi:CheY-like chemotaxis protein